MSFRGSDLSFADLQASNLGPMSLLDPSTGEQKGQWPSDLTGVVAVGAMFTRVNFGGASLAGGNFEGVDLTHAQMAGCAIDDANFEGAKLDRAQLPEGLAPPVVKADAG